MRYFKIIMTAIITSALVVTLCGCSKKTQSEMIPAGPLMAESIHLQFAVYYLPLPTGKPLSVLTKLIDGKYRKVNLVAQMREMPGELLVSAHVQDDVMVKYAPPDVKSLQYFGHGITHEQALALQKCKQALVLDFGYPKDRVWEGLRTANEMTEAIARKTGGLLWDEQTREVFSPDEWHQKRLESWTEDFPDISGQISIHAYKNHEYVRAITLGMSKIGLPDVVVEDFSWSLNRPVGNLINLFCQSMAEGATIAKRGDFDLELRTIKNRKVRDSQIKSLKKNAATVAFLSLKKGKRDEGDPQNRLIEISFDRYPGSDVHARQEKMLSSLFGWEDEVTQVRHNEELIAASRLARARLPELRKAFNAGLQPGEFIQVKAPFPVPDGRNEWMWVEITDWQGEKIKGLLKNEPYYIPSLHGGQIVEVDQEDIFDYIRRYPDGRQEGNKTGEIIRKLQDRSN
jgi:uncharacterized protein YegJ (DUF2314 family)